MTTSTFRLKFRHLAKTPRLIRAMRRNRGIALRPWHRRSATRFMLGELIQWWIEANDDEIPPPEAWDVAKIFRGADVDMLRNLLRHASDPRIRAACAAALGSLEVEDALSDLVEASFDPNVEVRQFAIWAVELIDPVWCGWRGVRNVWDFLFLALSLLPELKPRQMSLF